MSTRIMAVCWPLQMRPPAKSVLVALADMANDEGYCWPSIERLCERTCYGRTAVIEAIAWLEVRGAVRANRTNGRKTTYWVEPDKFAAEAVDNRHDQSATRTGPRAEPVRHADGTSPPRGPDQSATRTLIVINRQGIKKTPQPPADAGGELGSKQKPEQPADGEADGFEEFWRRYPRKKAEQRARRQWNRLQPNHALRVRILAAVDAQGQGAEWRREEGRFVPLASAWLHGERWRDGVGPALAPEPWDTNGATIQAKGVELGLGRWNEADLSPNRETFAAYTSRVRRAVEEKARQRSCEKDLAHAD